MTTAIIPSYKRFFQAAEIDFEAGKILTKENRCQPAIYHFQQAYEKIVKAYYALKETVDNRTPEPDIYRKIGDLRHNTHRSTMQLLHDIADIQIHGAEVAIDKIQDIQSRDPPSSTIDSRAVPLLQRLIVYIILNIQMPDRDYKFSVEIVIISNTGARFRV